MILDSRVLVTQHPNQQNINRLKKLKTKDSIEEFIFN